MEDDFRRCLKIIKLQLDGLIACYESAKDLEGIEQAVANRDTKEIIGKWSMDLLLMLIFAAEGQRPQVYTSLHCPDESELTGIRDQVGRIHFFEMRTTIERTKRKQDFTIVLVSESAFKYVAFHEQVTRRIIVRRT